MDLKIEYQKEIKELCESRKAIKSIFGKIGMIMTIFFIVVLLMVYHNEPNIHQIAVSALLVGVFLISAALIVLKNSTGKPTNVRLAVTVKKDKLVHYRTIVHKDGTKEQVVDGVQYFITVNDCNEKKELRCLQESIFDEVQEREGIVLVDFKSVFGINTEFIAAHIE